MLVRKCGIYKITNQVNGKVYIGQSVNIFDRWNDHKASSFNPNATDYNCIFHQAIRKYGLENFGLEIIEECLREELNQKEEYYISLYESYPPSKGKGYNQTPGGNSCDIRKLSKEDILKIIDFLKNSKLTFKAIAEMSKVDLLTISHINLGKTHFNSKWEYPIRRREKLLPGNCLICGAQLKYYTSKYCIKCVSLGNKKEVPPKEDLLKDLYEMRIDQKVAEKYGISTMLLKKWKEELDIPRKRPLVDEMYEEEYLHIEKKPKRNTFPKPILKIDPTTNEIVEEFLSAAEAGRIMGTTGWNIIQQCQKQKLYKNFYWKFKI